MKRLLSGIVTLAIVTATHGFADDVTVDTATGPVAVAALPEKVVVLDITAVDTLSALNVHISGTVNNMYVDYLDDVKANAEVVGSLFEPDFEAINALAPDLIIVGSRSSTQAEAMGKLAPTIVMTVWGDNLLEQSVARLRAYGNIFDKTEEAAAIETAFNSQLDAAKAAVQGKGTALIVMTNGPKVSAYGAGSRFGWLHNELGLIEAVKGVDEATHGEAISFEFIRDANPDWLLVVDRVAAIGADGENAAQTLDNELVADTTAWKTGQVIYLPSASIYVAGGGIQSLQITLKTITEAFAGGS